jgi:hypothetical protein
MTKQYRHTLPAVLSLVLTVICSNPTPGGETIFGGAPGRLEVLRLLDRLPDRLTRDRTIRVDLMTIFMSYPEHFKGLVLDGSGNLRVVMKDGTKIVYDDGKVKDFRARLTTPDLEDMLSLIYIPGKIVEPPDKDYDPGRFRVTPFFQAVYGKTREAVKANLVSVEFCGRPVPFNRQNGAAQALQRVGRELASLMKEKPRLKKYVFPVGGTFVWRSIAGTKRLSPHSFGIAIDLNPKEGAYWRNRGRGFDATTHLRGYPIQIVNLFEKHGFIWGGKWWHYDSMHFEYRPELLLKPKYSSNLGASTRLTGSGQRNKP